MYFSSFPVLLFNFNSPISFQHIYICFWYGFIKYLLSDWFLQLKLLWFHRNWFWFFFLGGVIINHLCLLRIKGFARTGISVIKPRKSWINCANRSRYFHFFNLYLLIPAPCVKVCLPGRLPMNSCKFQKS